MSTPTVNNAIRPSGRFWGKVAIAGPNDCWIWRASVDHNGHGKYRVGGKIDGAHRVAWTLSGGPIPAGAQVLHRCEGRYEIGDLTGRRCVNPAHLKLGTHTENMTDRRASGRWLAVAKLRPAAVSQIRFDYTNGSSKRALAKRYGVSRRQVSRIVSGESWAQS